jgi:hypothetical protein
MSLAAEATSGQLPFVADKPEPRSTTYTVLMSNGETASCGPRGDDQGDQDLNFLKNRVDQPDVWIQVDFDAVLNQAYPEAVGKHNRANWSENDMAAVKRYEGLPISIECYIAWANDEGKESCNCHIDDKAMFDIHIWLTKEPATIEGSKAPDRRRAVVAEVTPRLKPDHPHWTQNTLRRLAKEGKKVRVSGWLLLDQEHPEQLKATATHSQTRGTLWEIHPIMEIEVWDNDQWVPLDNLQAMAGPIADLAFRFGHTMVEM